MAGFMPEQAFIGAAARLPSVPWRRVPAAGNRQRPQLR